MPRLSHALCSRKRHVMQLTLAVGMLLGLAQLAHSQDTTCSAVRALKPGTCMTYTYGLPPVPYTLCNGPFSLCTTAQCTCKTGNCTHFPLPQDTTAACTCNVETGLSIRMGAVEEGSVSTISNFALAAGLGMKECSQAPLVNCLGAKCTTTDNQTSSCTCPVASQPGQLILEPVGTDVSCNELRSGAPISPKTKLLDQAYQAAVNCTRS